MGIFKEIKKSDGSGITTFYRLSQEFDTVTTDNKEKSEEMFDYNKALNKPSINGVYLIGNKTSEDLGLQPAGDYLTQVPEEYITETELGEYDSNIKIYIKEQINNIEHFRREIVDVLPLVGKSDILYMVLKEGSEGDIYNEYIWVDTKYELVGTTATDLSDYYKKNEISELLNNKVDKVSGKQLSTNDYTTEEKTKLANLENYNDSEIKNSLLELNNKSTALESSVSVINENIEDLQLENEELNSKVNEIEHKTYDDISGVRLVKSGDEWMFYDSMGNMINYETARNRLGNSDSILWYENLENDSKGFPAKYSIDEEVVHIYYVNDEGKDCYIKVGYPNVTEVSGTDIVIEDAVDYPLVKLWIDGASLQKTTTGKNLILIESQAEQTLGGITGTINDDGSITFKGVATDNPTFYFNCTNPFSLGQYTFSIKETHNFPCYIRLQDSVNGEPFYQILTGNNKVTFDYESDGYFKNNKYRIMVWFPKNLCPIGTEVDFTIYPQLEIGDTATNYEPYTGKRPSPSPDYPQEINSVEGNLDLKIFNGIEILQNQIEIGSISSGNGANASANNRIRTIDYINCNNFKYLKYSGLFSAIVFCYDNSKKYLGRIADDWQTDNPLELNLLSNTTYIKIAWKYSDDRVITSTNELHDVYLYNQFNEITFNLKEEKLRSVGDIADELTIDLDTGDYYKVNNIKELIFNGSEDWEVSGGSFATLPTILPKKPVNNDTVGVGISSHYIITTYNDLFYERKDYGFGISANSYKINFRNVDITTINDFKSWLSENNIIINYLLETPTTTFLGTLSAEDLAKLKTFEGYNNVFVNTNIGLAEIKLTYVTNVNYLDTTLGYSLKYQDNKNDITEPGYTGEIRVVGDNKDIYMYDKNNWIPFNKDGQTDLSNYLSKTNTTPYAPTGDYNPATKQYVDNSVGDVFVPTRISQLENDANFITNSTNTLENYYNKTNTYNKKEIDALLDASGLNPVSITLNGAKTNDAIFYAPVDGGDSGKVLVSGGAGANPTWGNVDYNNLSNKPVLSSVAGSGSYNDLVDKPYIPAPVPEYDGTAICGWYVSAPEGTNMTQEYGMSVQSAENIKVGAIYWWDSTVSFTGENSAVCYYVSRDRGYGDDGTYYTSVKAKIGQSTDFYTFVYDDTTVYKGLTWPSDSPGKACFSGDTLIWAENGLIPIKDINVGDKVYSINREKTAIVLSEVINTISHNENNLLEIKTKDNNIYATRSHPFYTKNKGRVNARMLEIDDEMVDSNRNIHKIYKINEINENMTVYEILVKDTYNYFITEDKIRVYNEPSVIDSKK